MTWPTTLRRAGRDAVLLDRAVYDAVHATPSPGLDRALARLSAAADHSKLWLACAGALSLAGERPRRSALVGLVAVGLTSAVVNLAVKPVVRRERPVRSESVRTHLVPMPLSASYPSGHAASAFAFSTAVGGDLPQLDSALRVTAAAVGWSRVHTGVHFPGDVVAGALIGAGIGSAVRHLAHRAGLTAPVSGGSRSADPRAASAPTGCPASRPRRPGRAGRGRPCRG